MFRKNFKLIATASTCALLGVGAVTYNQPYLLAEQLEQPSVFEETEKTNKAKECTKLIKRYKEEFGIPGIVVAVSKNGQTIYNRGFGYSDVENCVKANAHTLMRIASISKPISCTMAGILYENGKLDFDKPIDEYIGADVPVFQWKNKQVKITSRQLTCHRSGIRHYREEGQEERKGKPGDSKFEEFLSNKQYKTTKDALSIFINDELQFEPGTDHLYTTYGFTVLGAVLEKCNGNKPFKDMLNELFKSLEMNETYVDLNNPLIANRSKYYERNKSSRLVNVPEVDSSYKFAGGGILSTTGDLLKFGNHMLNAYQDNSPADAYKLLTSSTIKSLLWSPQSNMPKKDSHLVGAIDFSKSTVSYGMGWVVSYNNNTGNLECVHHTGGAVGASSCLLIVPGEGGSRPGGLVVAVLCNSQNVAEIVKFTQSISKVFQ